jgi:hypothetical protein
MLTSLTDSRQIGNSEGDVDETLIKIDDVESTGCGWPPTNQMLMHMSDGAYFKRKNNFRILPVLQAIT